jgi:Rrf2 family protein
VRITAKTDYAIRAAVELAFRQAGNGPPLKAESIAEAQAIPLPFLQIILADLRRYGLITSRRGIDGGWRLTRSANAITVADVVHAINGSIANIAGIGPEELDYRGAARSLKELWITLDDNVRGVLEGVTLADLAAGRFPGPPASSAATPAS